MTKRIAMWGIVASATLCGMVCMAVLTADTEAPPEVPVDQPQASQLGDTIDVSLAELLTKPRAELATLADEWLTKARVQDRARREGRLQFTLVPNVRLPLAVPVLREAKYSAKAGFSLPPYATEGAHDVGLALHFARYGDIEAARQLVDPADTATLARIEACRCERNYPIEWTRLTALMLQVAQVRLAHADVEGGTELLVLHRQVRGLLDAKAAEGPLGAVLLGSGRIVFAGAATAWREAKKNLLADQADAGLAEWGPAPAETLPVKPGAPRAEVVQLLRSPVQGHVLPAVPPERAFDVLDLPFPDEGVTAVVAFFDKAEKLAELLVTYRVRTGEEYLDASQFAHRLEDRGIASQERPKALGLRGRVYLLDNTNCDVVLVGHGAGVGAWVRLTAAPTPRITPTLARDFGAVRLDRSFEQNRRLVAVEQRGDLLTVEQSRALGRVKNPLSILSLARVVLQREAGHDLTRAMTLSYTEDATSVPLHQVALPLWSAHGAARMEGVEDSTGGHLALTWEDAQTRYTLRLPYENTHPIELEALDHQGAEEAAARVDRAANLDRSERQARIAAGKPLARIPRELEQVRLGLSRAQVLQLLPVGRAVLKQEIPDGLSVTFNGEASRTATHALRQLLVRFDAGKVAEVRVRYFNADHQANTRWAGDLLNRSKKAGGAPEEQASSWRTGWADRPPRKTAPVAYSWQDDVTWMTYQRDGDVVELRVRDCPLEHVAGVPLPPLQALPRGPEKCLLGTARSDLLRAWGIGSPVTTGDGALVLSPRPPAPYDAVLVWFEEERVVRVVARHAPSGEASAAPAKMGSAVADAWTRDARSLGWPLRQETTPQEVLQALGWLDERTRIRLFWQENEDGACRLFTEWKELPRP